MGRRRFSRREIVRRWAKRAAKRAVLAAVMFVPRQAWRVGIKVWKPVVTGGCCAFTLVTASHYYAPWYLRYERHAIWKASEAQATMIEAVARLGGFERPVTPREELSAIEIVEREALRNRFAPGFGRAWFQQEGSRGNPRARSPKGAVGVLQIMPATGRSECGLTEVELENPELNARCAFQYLRKLLAMFDGNLWLAMTAYNGGPTAVRVINKCGSNRGCLGGYTESYDYFPSIAAKMAADIRG